MIRMLIQDVKAFDWNDIERFEKRPLREADEDFHQARTS